jgi:hypothetical protein
MLATKTEGARDEMTVLRIEHPVPDFAAWKAAFDSDPVGRERGGVTGYRILRPVDDPDYALIDLDFDTADDAEAFLALLRGLWQRVEGEIMREPRARILDVVEGKEY